MPGHFSNPVYVNPGASGGSGVTTAVITVADQAARLALLSANAAGRIVKQTSDQTAWCLRPNGVPATPADWELLGHYALLTSRVPGLDAALAAKAPLASPPLTGVPTAPTAAPGTNTTQLATTAYVVAGLSGKTDNGHTHSIGNISGLQAQLDGINTGLALKAPLASPPLTGVPTAPTATPGTNTTQIATTAFVVAAISGLSGGASAAWGSITGSLSSQADLWNALSDAKARANHTGSQAMGTITGLDAALSAKAPLASPGFTGVPTVPTAAPGTNTIQAASTAFVQAAVAAGGGGGGGVEAARVAAITLGPYSSVFVNLATLFPTVDLERAGWDISWAAFPVAGTVRLDGNYPPTMQFPLFGYPLLAVSLANNSGFSVTPDLEFVPIMLDLDPENDLVERRTLFRLTIMPLGIAAKKESRQGVLYAQPEDNRIGESDALSYEPANSTNLLPSTYGAAGWDRLNPLESSVRLRLGRVTAAALHRLVFQEALSARTTSEVEGQIIIEDLTIRPLL
jgi:hypothetical protein